MAIDWGSVPDWLAGEGAISALLFAAQAVRSSRRTNDMQSEQLAQLEEDGRRRDDLERRSHAAKVAVYVSVDRSGSGEFRVKFFNRGEMSIYGLTIFLTAPSGIVQKTFSVTGPHPETITFDHLTSELRNKVGPTAPISPDGDIDLAAACSFRDSNGLWWYRTATGVLSEAPDGDAAAEGARSGLWPVV